MKSLFFTIIVIFLASMSYGQSQSNFSKWTLPNPSSPEYSLSAKAKLLQNYNLKLREVLKNNSKIQKQALDSLYLLQMDTNNAAIGSKNYTFTYDASGKQTSVTIFEKNLPSALWNKSKKEVFLYNAYGQLITDIVYEWNTILNMWVESQKWENTYNSSGLITQLIQSYWNNASYSWEKHSRLDYTYDASLNPIQYTYYSWDKPTALWVKGSIRVYTYNLGQLTEYMDYMRDSLNHLIPFHKIIYDYYANDSLKTTVGQYFNKSLGLWFYIGKLKNIYDSNNDPILRLEYDYNVTQNTWDTTHKIEKTFYPNHQVSSSIYFSKDSLNLWVPNAKTEYTTDSQGIVTDISRYGYKAIYGIWIPEYRSGFYLDHTTAYSNLILPMEYEGDYIEGKIDHAKRYDYDPWTVSWRYLQRYQYYYGFQTVGLSANTNPSDGVEIYPNPSTGTFRINLPENFQEANINVTNISGKEIFKRKIQKTQSTEVELNVAPGFYFVRILESKGYQKTFKVIVK